MFENLLSLAIRLAAAAVVLGWGLSAVGGVSPRGYLVVGLPMLAFILWSVDWRPWARFGRVTLHRPLVWWKHRQWLPLAFLLVTGLIVLGSALHEPNNFDGLNYRAPKVLHWLEQGRWHWIHASCPFINYTFPNYEWLTVPIFLLSKGFHATVAINWVAYALLPGLFFSLMRMLGAGARPAYDWMWLFPTGYILGMEAGGIGNDLVGLTAVLASIHCAGRFLVTNKRGYLLDALLAAGFCTGVKISNLPLGALVLIVLMKDPVRVLRQGATVAVGTALGLASSGLIPLVLNRLHTGSILGETGGRDQTTSAVAGLVGNTLTLLETALAPPLGGSRPTGWLDQHLAGLLAGVHEHYTRFTLRLNDLPQEEMGGFGIGVTLGLLLCVWLWWRGRGRKHPGPGASMNDFQLGTGQKLLLFGWLAVPLVYLLARLSLGSAMPRVLMAWLALLLAGVLAAVCTEPVVRARLWRRLAPWLSLSLVPALLLSPSRPLIPPSALLAVGHKLKMSEPALQQIQVVYDVYGRRGDPFVELRQSVPPETPVLAVVSDGFDSTAAYWKPYTKRRCVDWLSDEEVRAALAQASAPLYVVLKEEGCERFFHLDIDGWLRTYGGTPLKSVEMRVLASHPPHRFTLARLDPRQGRR